MVVSRVIKSPKGQSQLIKSQLSHNYSVLLAKCIRRLTAQDIFDTSTPCQWSLIKQLAGKRTKEQGLSETETWQFHTKADHKRS